MPLRSKTLNPFTVHCRSNEDAFGATPFTVDLETPSSAGLLLSANGTAVGAVPGVTSWAAARGAPQWRPKAAGKAGSAWPMSFRRMPVGWRAGRFWPQRKEPARRWPSSSSASSHSHLSLHLRQVGTIACGAWARIPSYPRRGTDIHPATEQAASSGNRAGL